MRVAVSMLAIGGRVCKTRQKRTSPLFAPGFYDLLDFIKQGPKGARPLPLQSHPKRRTVQGHPSPPGKVQAGFPGPHIKA